MSFSERRGEGGGRRYIPREVIGAEFLKPSMKAFTGHDIIFY